VMGNDLNGWKPETMSKDELKVRIAELESALADCQSRLEQARATIGEIRETYRTNKPIEVTDRGLVRNECYKCIHKRNVSGNTHIKCVKPDFEMTGDTHGIGMGWFIYPELFDPAWMTHKCANFEEVTS